MKTYSTQANIGKAKHIVSFHNGRTTHRDGSPFFDIALFRSIRARDAFCKGLKAQGYAPR